ncbi:queuine tRNA-ribosyltransferase accessory subunit 2 [Anopheles darlingi]|uniref:queuine tRNA-ribosyltransferase accessory subunit 2 n=1 Tax=Anopheles darlingi TaxID=43151 RepID=UPI0021005D86|nr:queuine tRNA-ribosyltransferase accessory subunit 2 [Anopheles darlingi]
MKFTLNTVTKCSGRLGLWNGLERLPNVALQTPGLIFHTKGGSVPHVSKEVLQQLSSAPQFLQMSISNTIHMQEAVQGCQKTLGQFVVQNDAVSMLVLRDPSEVPVSGVPERDAVPIYTRCGRRTVKVDAYMRLVETFQPDLYVPLYDGDTELGCSKKREQKSVERTETLVQECLEWHRKSEKLSGHHTSLIAPVVGGYSEKLREKAIEWLRQTEHDFAGYLIEGLHTYDPSLVSRITSETILPIVTPVCKALPEERVRLCFGAYDPTVVLELVSAGVDVFDTSYVYLKAAQQHRALIFSFNVSAPEAEEQQESSQHTTELDTTDTRWAEDFSPLLAGCSCYTCQKHSKAYVHHLYNTREMLGPILLMIHNLHHYMEFFKTIRHHVAQDTLPQLREHLSLQRTLPPYVEKEDKKQAIPMGRKEATPPEEPAVDLEEKLAKKQRS